MKKQIIVFALLCVGILLSIQAATPSGFCGVAQFHQNPPTPKHFWIKKLEQPLQTGETMIMRIEFEPHDQELPNPLQIAYGEDQNGEPLYVEFHRGPGAPDPDINEQIWSGYISEDVNDFLTSIRTLENNLINGAPFIHFSGHAGELFQLGEVTRFDYDKFAKYEYTDIDPLLLEIGPCLDDIEKEKSLFITDLSVVEDPARTHNFVADPNGSITNMYGVWTFGTLMQNAAYGVSTREFLKSFVKHWMYSLNVNGQTVAAREAAFRHMILPWLQKAYGTTQNFAFADWETIWDDDGPNGVSTEALLRSAPFKLTAIVNRLDLRGNTGFAELKNAGETRFIFTLINPFTGNIPHEENQCSACAQDDLDWEGLNVIFEYANIIGSRCELREFAQKWANLSNYQFGEPTFNDLLQEITDDVTAANVAPWRTNGTALLRIRTNERIFQGVPSNHGSWDVPLWELRQLEINESGLLEVVPVSQTPAKGMNTVNSLAYTNYQTENSLSTPPSTDDNHHFLNWVFASALRKQAIINERHEFPLTLNTANGTIPFRSATAIVGDRIFNFWDFPWNTATSQAPNFSPVYSTGSHPVEKDLRRRLSLNTCQGCHAGETKTIFTHVMPLRFGDQARYWMTGIPNDDYYKQGEISLHNSAHDNLGTTIIASQTTDNYTKPLGHRYFQKVSAFLTGKRYDGALNNGSWSDDESDTGTDPHDSGDDKTLLFYVNDPSNGVGPNPHKRWGYNDLQRRKQDLCRLLNSHCYDVLNPGVTMSVVAAATQAPFSLGAH